ncbi:hypothetical protein PENPOL_c007G07554 [Penicillium polonicum]|uniref:Uncharacterized protein n=1 Tax=Penicillium polonicum TaxID=60169 RepID=A0A1V6NIY9_PENPO|nr:hypothetical protein PENPOL_c007G07554 [Penicillium polonicum]
MKDLTYKELALT